MVKRMARKEKNILYVDGIGEFDNCRQCIKALRGERNLLSLLVEDDEKTGENRPFLLNVTIDPSVLVIRAVGFDTESLITFLNDIGL
jgi:hypothetical protein